MKVMIGIPVSKVPATVPMSTLKGTGNGAAMPYVPTIRYGHKVQKISVSPDEFVSSWRRKNCPEGEIQKIGSSSYTIRRESETVATFRFREGDENEWTQKNFK